MSPRNGPGRYDVNLLTTIAPGSTGVFNPASNVLTQWGLGAYTQGGVAVQFDEGGTSSSTYGRAGTRFAWEPKNSKA